MMKKTLSTLLLAASALFCLPPAIPADAAENSGTACVLLRNEAAPAEAGCTASEWVTAYVSPTAAAPPYAGMAAKPVRADTPGQGNLPSNTSDQSNISLVAASLAVAALIGFATYRKD